MLKHGARRVLLQAGRYQRQQSRPAQRVDGIIEEQRALWVARNRLGGLSDSIADLEAARELYRDDDE